MMKHKYRQIVLACTMCFVTVLAGCVNNGTKQPKNVVEAPTKEVSTVTAAPTKDPVADVTIEPTAAPVPEETVDPSVEPASELISEPDAELTSEATAQPSPELLAEATTEVDSESEEGITASSSELPSLEPAEFVFEAEWADGIEFLQGFDYSGTIQGLDMIQKDYYKKGASNDYYVCGLYGEGLELAYTVISDRDVDNATLILRLSAEYMDIAINPSTYRIVVNGNDVSYKTIKFKGVPVSDRANLLDFEDYTITTTLHLQEGENNIQFITANNNPMTGTMYATAPLVDCFKITASANLTWDPCRSNTAQD